jgi:hypothetical protein
MEEEDGRAWPEFVGVAGAAATDPRKEEVDALRDGGVGAWGESSVQKTEVAIGSWRPRKEGPSLVAAGLECEKQEEKRTKGGGPAAGARGSEQGENREGCGGARSRAAGFVRLRARQGQQDKGGRAA